MWLDAFHSFIYLSFELLGSPLQLIHLISPCSEARKTIKMHRTINLIINQLPKNGKNLSSIVDYVND